MHDYYNVMLVSNSGKFVRIIGTFDKKTSIKVAFRIIFLIKRSNSKEFESCFVTIKKIKESK